MNKVWSTKLIPSDVIIQKEFGIYKITNIVDNKIYVGSAVNLRSRNRDHYFSLNLNKHHSILLQRSWNKHGESNFKFEILELVPDKSNLIQREQYFIDTLNPFYNICKVAGSQLGFKHSEKTKQKQSSQRKEKIDSGEIITWNKGLSLPPREQSTKDKISLTTTGVKKKPFTEEHKQKLSIKAKERKLRENENRCSI